jgi:hypothetical protein
MRHWRAFIVLCIILGVLSALGDAWITGEPPRIIAGIIGTVVSGVGLLCAWFFFLSTGVAGPRMTAWADIDDERRPRAKISTTGPKCPRCAAVLSGDLEAGCPECGWGRDAIEGSERSKY